LSPRQILLLVSLMVFPMAVMATTECPAGNWRNAGYQDGVNGQPVHWITRYRKACELADSPFDRDTYLTARREGLERYCRAYNGYELGARGAPYYGACPAKLEGGFLDAYRTGARLHGLHRKIRALDRQIVWYEERILELTDSARHDAAVIAERSARFQAEIDRLEEERATYLQRLELYKTRVAGIS